uniref:ADAM metallopeptidase domain 23a n=1 Tax=Anabas testudineus TaxID=64144 RepID=A0A7N6BUY5_ANATE
MSRSFPVPVVAAMPLKSPVSLLPVALEWRKDMFCAHRGGVCWSTSSSCLATAFFLLPSSSSSSSSAATAAAAAAASPVPPGSMKKAPLHVPALLKQQATAAPATDNTIHHAVEHAIAYPSRLIYYLNEDSESTYHDLDTRVKNQAVHLAQASFQLEAFGFRYILDLMLNNDLLSSDYVEIHYEEGKPVLSKGGEHCYYHGEVRGNNNSHVALSTCNGLQFTPGVVLLSPVPFLLSLSLFLSASFSILPYSSIHCTLQWQIFKEQLHTRVVLVAVEMWTDKDQIPISVRPLEMLRDFSKYRQQSIKHHADAVHLFSNVTFHYRRSSAAYFGGMCSVSRGVGVNEYGSTWSMAASLSQSLAQNLGIQWDPASRRKECGCAESWTGCIMEDTGVQHSRRFSKCSISDYKEFLLKGGGSCLFNRPTKVRSSSGRGVDVCCRLGCSDDDGPCCNSTCLFYPRGYSCRYAVNDCDISETCSGDSGQCPLNLHKQDGYFCQVNQGRCYNGECKTRENQCKYIWGPKAGGSERFCYEKLNTEGTEKGNCGKDGDKWIQCSKHDVFCGYLLCTNIGRAPRIGMMKGDVTPTSFNHQGRVVECGGGHVLLDDETDLGYVEDGTPCGPSMMCLNHKCLPIQSLNMSTCPSGPNGQVCSAHGVCNNEATCTCDTTWAGTDCSMPDPPKEPETTQDEGPKGPSATNLIIGSIAGAILVAAIVLGGTGWGFK